MDMQKIARLIKKIFFLPPIPTLLIAIPAFVFLFYVLTNGTGAPAIEYLSYVLSAYAMIITITGIGDIVMWIRRGFENHPFIRRILNIPLVERYFSETTFRAEISLYPSLAIILFYAGIKLVLGICYRSVWFGTLSVYYVLLALMRFSLLYHVRRRERVKHNSISELKICRLCGIILMIHHFTTLSMITK